MKFVEQNYCACRKCEESYIFTPDEAWWDEKGYGYSTKLTKCPYCGCINVVQYIEDYGFSIMNTDQRYFD